MACRHAPVNYGKNACTKPVPLGCADGAEVSGGKGVATLSSGDWFMSAVSDACRTPISYLM